VARFQTVKSDIFVHALRCLSIDPSITAGDIAAEHPRMRESCEGGYHSSVHEEFVLCFSQRGDTPRMCEHLQLLDEAWPGRLRALLSPTTIAAVRRCAEDAKELPAWVRPLLLQVLSAPLDNATYPGEEVADFGFSGS
jgi:hypothetical protein